MAGMGKLKNLLKKSLLVSIFFTILVMLVAALGIFSGISTAVFVLLIAVLLIVATWIVGVGFAIADRTSKHYAAEYSLFVGFFAAVLIILMFEFFVGTVTLGSYTSPSLFNSTNLLLYTFELFVFSFVSLVIVELAGWCIEKIGGSRK